jgi:hypothetical protein
MFKDSQGREITLGAFVAYASTRGMKIGRVTKVTSRLVGWTNQPQHSLTLSIYRPSSHWTHRVTLQRPDRSLVVPESTLTPEARAFFRI